jgi:uncharacterized membrane-anchored protein
MIRHCLKTAAIALATGLCLAPMMLAQEPAPAPQLEAPAADAAAAEMTEAELEAAIKAEKEEFETTITRRTGVIDIVDGQVQLNVPDGFYYLDPKDANHVLVDAWGNPEGPPTQGMLFPANVSPLDEDNWGVVIEFDDSGYVSDKDASKINYDDLLKDMRESQVQENAERKKQGYEAIDLVGWARAPRYDAASHKLYWAKDLLFEGMSDHTLNYNMRILGRKGVLVLNFVAGMNQLDAVERASPAVLALADFKPGSRYEDFNAATDKKAEIGIAGLIAGGAGVVLAKKAGLLGIALIFLKKAWFLIAAAIAGVGGVVKRFFGGKPKLTPEEISMKEAIAASEAQMVSATGGDAPGGEAPKA